MEASETPSPSSLHGSHGSAGHPPDSERKHGLTVTVMTAPGEPVPEPDIKGWYYTTNQRAEAIKAYVAAAKDDQDYIIVVHGR